MARQGDRGESRVALARARTLKELLLETEPEWRLYEEPRARNVTFKLRAQTPRLRTEDDLRARVRFELDGDCSVVWAGAAGFVMRDGIGGERSAPTVQAVIDTITRPSSLDPAPNL